MKNVDRTLLESERKYRRLFSDSEEAIFITSKAGECLDARGELCYKALHDLSAVCPWCVNHRVFAGETVRWEAQSPRDHRLYYVVNTSIYHEDGAMSKQSLLLDDINMYISAKESPLQVQPMDVKGMLRTIRREFSPRLDRRKIRWREPGSIPPVHGDRMSQVRVMRNLVDMALKYGGDGLTEITIRYEATPEHHIFSVKNDGRGIGPEDAKKIFRLFTRRNGAQNIQGTGLGLAIVKEIAQRHRGGVWVSPESKRGVTFYVSFARGLR